MALSDEVAALRDELARLLADQAAFSSDAGRQERALEAQLQAITHRESHATNDCAARVAEITTALVSNELSTVDEDYVPVDGTAALASTYGGVQAEYTALREEEMQREARIAAMEQALAASQERAAATAARFDGMLREIQEARDTLARREDQERATIAALDAEKHAARRVIAEHSETQAQRLMGLWDSEAAAVSAAVAAEFEPRFREVARESDAAVADSTAAARGIARHIAAYLASRARGEYTSTLAAVVARLEAQRANHARVAPRLLAARARVLKALLDVRAGKGGSGGGGGGNPTAGGAGADDEDLRPLIEAFPLLADALPNAAPRSGVASTAGLLRGATGAGGADGGAAAAGAQAAGAAPIPPARPPPDVYAKLEEQDASSLRLPLPAARQELGRLMEVVLQRWADLPGSRPDDCVALLRDAQQAVTGATRPPMKLPRSASASAAAAAAAAASDASYVGGVGDAAAAAEVAASIEAIMHPEEPQRVTDVGREYRREAERLLAAEQITLAEQRLGQLLQDRRRAEAALNSTRTHSGSSGQVQSALEATRGQIRLEPEIQRLEGWLGDAMAQYRERFGAHAALNQAEAAAAAASAAEPSASLLSHEGGASSGDGSGGRSSRGGGGGGLDLEPPLVPTPRAVDVIDGLEGLTLRPAFRSGAASAAGGGGAAAGGAFVSNGGARGDGLSSDSPGFHAAQHASGTGGGGAVAGSPLLSRAASALAAAASPSRAGGLAGVGAASGSSLGSGSTHVDMARALGAQIMHSVAGRGGAEGAGAGPRHNGGSNSRSALEAVELELEREREAAAREMQAAEWEAASGREAAGGGRAVDGRGHSSAAARSGSSRRQARSARSRDEEEEEERAAAGGSSGRGGAGARDERGQAPPPLRQGSQGSRRASVGASSASAAATSAAGGGSAAHRRASASRSGPGGREAGYGSPAAADPTQQQKQQHFFGGGLSGRDARGSGDGGSASQTSSPLSVSAMLRQAKLESASVGGR